MAHVAATMKVVYNDFPDLPRRTRRECDRAAQRSAERVAAGARKNTTRVKTGAMKAGWTVEPGEQQGERVVTNPVDYAIFHELGTVHLTAAPMLGPAVEDERASGRFENEIREAVGRAAAKSVQP